MEFESVLSWESRLHRADEDKKPETQRQRQPIFTRLYTLLIDVCLIATMLLIEYYYPNERSVQMGHPVTRPRPQLSVNVMVWSLDLAVNAYRSAAQAFRYTLMWAHLVALKQSGTLTAISQ